MSQETPAKLALVRELHDVLHGVWHLDQPTNVARSLLPVVRAYAAEELREAAAEVRDNHGTASLSASRIDARADALNREATP